jgi:hypothetical protein
MNEKKTISEMKNYELTNLLVDVRDEIGIERKDLYIEDFVKINQKIKAICIAINPEKESEIIAKITDHGLFSISAFPYASNDIDKQGNNFFCYFLDFGEI